VLEPSSVEGLTLVCVIQKTAHRKRAEEKVDRSQSGTVYKISCTNCSFVYYGQTERSLKTRITEHKRAVSVFDHDSKISCHVHESNHKMDFGSVRVVGHEANFHERLFLEAWMSIKDAQSGNDHIAIPEIYKSLARAQVSRYVFLKLHAEFSSARFRRAVF